MRGYFFKDRKAKVIAVAALMIASILTRVPTASTEEESPLWMTPALDEEAKNCQPLEHVATNATAADTMEREGSNPLYVLVVGDEEEQGVLRSFEDPPVRARLRNAGA